jgi:hypothetical protein
MAMMILVILVSSQQISMVCGADRQGMTGQGTSLQVEEERMEALFIWQFLQFTEWPQSMILPDASGSYSVGVIGTNRVGTFLEELARQKKLPDGSVIVVKRIMAPEDVEKCRIIYIAPTIEPAKASQLLARMRNKPVLTIGHEERFMERGGIINLYTENDRLKFEVNLAEANNSKLKLSARLLRLAKIYNR